MSDYAWVEKAIEEKLIPKDLTTYEFGKKEVFQASVEIAIRRLMISSPDKVSFLKSDRDSEDPYGWEFGHFILRNSKGKKMGRIDNPSILKQLTISNVVPTKSGKDKTSSPRQSRNLVVRNKVESIINDLNKEKKIEEKKIEEKKYNPDTADLLDGKTERKTEILGKSKVNLNKKQFKKDKNIDSLSNLFDTSARNDPDFVRSYLEDVYKVPLLTYNEEMTLGKQVQKYMEIERAELEMIELTGEQPTKKELATKFKLTINQLEKRLTAGENAKERMVAANLSLVVRVAKKYKKVNMELLDLIQEGTIGLVRAAEKFDPARGYKFSTYAYWWIRQGISRAIAEKNLAKRLPIHITEMLNKLKKGQRELSQKMSRTPTVSELAKYLELPEEDVKDLMCKIGEPVSLETKFGDSEDTVLLDLLTSGEDLPEEQIKMDCMKGDLHSFVHQLPDLQCKVLRMRYGMDGDEPMSLSGIGKILGISRDRVRNLERDGLRGLRRLSDNAGKYYDNDTNRQTSSKELQESFEEKKIKELGLDKEIKYNPGAADLLDAKTGRRIEILRKSQKNLNKKQSKNNSKQNLDSTTKTKSTTKVSNIKTDNFMKESDARQSSKNDHLNDLLSELQELIGLKSVKEEVSFLISFVRAQKKRRSLGLKSENISNHFLFLGSPGTGKTEVARLIGKIFKALGILKKGHFVETDRSQLVAGYIGHTAQKTLDVCNKALDGVLFIDEAYSLSVGDSYGDFGSEAIATLLKFMEDKRDQIIVIAAGYPKEMQDFLNSNSGLKSRFNTTLIFEDYKEDELFEILKFLAEKKDHKIHKDSFDYLRKIIREIFNNKSTTFGNGRVMRNLLEIAIKKQSHRLINSHSESKEDFIYLRSEDFTLTSHQLKNLSK